jgi:hypothetical protein
MLVVYDAVVEGLHYHKTGPHCTPPDFSISKCELGAAAHSACRSVMIQIFVQLQGICHALSHTTKHPTSTTLTRSELMQTEQEVDYEDCDNSHPVRKLVLFSRRDVMRSEQRWRIRPKQAPAAPVQSRVFA